MRARTMFGMVVTVAWALACAGGSEEGAEKGPGGGEGDVGNPDAAPLEPGQIHLAYPTVGTDAVAGQFVLSPSRDTLDRAVNEGSGTFIYYGAEMLEPGEVESKVKSLAGSEFMIPNSLIVPIDRAYAASPGDILLGHWESGSGMRRAIVTGGTPTAPVVRYLDRAYDQEHEGDQSEDTFEEHRFEPLTEAWQVGTTVACGEGNTRDHGILVHAEGDRILVSGFASKLEAFDKSQCVGLAPKSRYAEGDSVWVPAVGAFNQGTVTKVEPGIGRVWVRYEWGGKEKVEAFPVVDIIRDFDESGDDRAGGGRRGGGDKGGGGEKGGGGAQRPPREGTRVGRPGRGD